MATSSFVARACRGVVGRSAPSAAAAAAAAAARPARRSVIVSAESSFAGTTSVTATAAAAAAATAAAQRVAVVSRGLSAAAAGGEAGERGVNKLFRPAPSATSRSGQASAEGAAAQEARAAAAASSGEAVHRTLQADPRHWDEEWSHDAIKEAADAHALMTWGQSKPMRDGALYAVKGDGVYFETRDGKRLMDFNSQAMCLNLGHTPPPEVVEAVTEQLKTLAYVYPGVAMTEVRARLSQLLAEICPGDINGFTFPSTGMEANEMAVRIARVYTGRHKIMSRYRSYHGSSSTTMAMTGDFRSVPATGTANGHVHFFDPYPYTFKWGETEEEITKNCLQATREQVESEGPQTIAAIFIETITGTNGLLPPPPGYLEGLREICDEHGILLVCDEVMAGFGRSGRLFGFEHSNILPDLVTAAKGINGGFVPLGMVAMRQYLKDHFEENILATGSTYNSHPISLASAYAAIKHMVANDVVGNAARMEEHMIKGHEKLIANHPSVKQARQIGLFGAFDLQKNRQGDFIGNVFDPPSPALLALKKELINNGLFTMMRGHNVFTNPPLNITKEEIEKGFDIIDKSLHVVDELMED